MLARQRSASARRTGCRPGRYRVVMKWEGDRLAAVAVIASLAGALGGSWLGASLSTRGADEQRMVDRRLDAYVAYLGARDTYVSTLLTIAWKQPDACLEEVISDQITSDCKISQEDYLRKQTYGGALFIATQRVRLVATQEVLREIDKDATETSSLFLQSDPLVIGVPVALAQWVLDSRSGGGGTRDSLPQKLLAAMSCDVRGAQLSVSEEGTSLSDCKD